MTPPEPEPIDAAPEAPETRRPRGRAWKRLLIWTTLLLGALLLADVYLARHRQLLVVNGYEENLVVNRPGHPPLAVGSGNRAILTIAEGDHEVQVEGPVHETVRVQIPQDRRERWLGGSDRILNPGGAALLVQETLHATTNGPKREVKYLFGDRMVVLPKVDFLFSEFPNNVQPKPQASLIRLDMVRGPLDELLGGLMGRGDAPQALRLLEWRLQLHPDRTALLTPYVGMSLGSGNDIRARDFLQWGTTLQPLRIQWHRFYQDVAMHMGGQATLVAHYDRLLEQQPTNSALAYLRGRICTHRHEALPYYERALRLDPANAFAHNATAFVCAGTGDWPTALKHATRAIELEPTDPQMQELLFDAQLAAGSLEQMEEQWRAIAQAKPMDVLPQLRLATVLAARGRTNEVNELVKKYAENLTAQPGPRAQFDLLQLQYQAAYLTGAFDRLLTLIQEHPKAFEAFEKFQALIAAGRLEEIDQVLRPETARAFDPFHVLLVGLAWETTGHPDRAAPWLKEALVQLRAERPEYAIAAEMLAHPEQTALTDVLDLGIAPHFKALLLAGLSLHHPEQAEPMRQAARHLNVRRDFPHHWINRLTENPPTRPPPSK